MDRRYPKYQYSVKALLALGDSDFSSKEAINNAIDDIANQLIKK